MAISLSEVRAIPAFKEASDQDIINYAKANNLDASNLKPEKTEPLTLEQVREIPQFANKSDAEILAYAQENGFDTSGLMPEYTASAKAGDVGRLFMQGVAGIGGNVGYLLQKTGIAPETGKMLRESGASESERLGSHLSPQMQEAQSTPLVNPNYDANAEGGSSYLNPKFGLTALTANVIPSIPSTIAMGAASAPLMAGAEAGLGALGVGQKLAPILAKAPLKKEALEEAAAGINRVIGSGIGAGAVEGPMSAVQDADQWGAEQRKKDIKEFYSSPLFQQELKTNGGDAQAAKEAVINAGENKILRDVSWQTAAVDVATGGGLLGVIRGSRAPLATAVRDGFLADTAKGMGSEFTQEFLQSGGEQHTMNQAQGLITPTQKEWEGVANAALTGGAAGGVMGIAGGAGHLGPLGRAAELNRFAGVNTPVDKKEAQDQADTLSETEAQIRAEEAAQAAAPVVEQNPIVTQVPSDQYGNPLTQVEPDLAEQKARIQRTNEEIKKLNASEKDPRKVIIGEKTVPAEAFMRQQIRHSGLTFAEAKANFNQLHEEQNPTEKSTNVSTSLPASNTPDTALPVGSESTPGSTGGELDNNPVLASDASSLPVSSHENNLSATAKEDLPAPTPETRNAEQPLGDLPTENTQLTPTETQHGDTQQTAPIQETPHADAGQEEKRLLRNTEEPTPLMPVLERTSSADTSIEQQPTDTDTTTSNQNSDRTNNGPVSETSTVQPISSNSGTGSEGAQTAAGPVSSGQVVEGTKSTEQKGKLADQPKLQVKNNEGNWQYVSENPDGQLSYGIYPTDALTADKLDYAQKKNPGAEFRIEPPSRTSPDEASRRASQKTEIDRAAHEAATSPLNELPQPTQAQKNAGNYKKGHVENFHGLDLTFENPKGSERSGVSKDGKPWTTTLQHHYGYIKKSLGNDGDHVDFFMGDHPASEKAFIVNQSHPETGKFDEHKVMLGFASAQEAKAAYHANYEKGWQGFGSMTTTTVAGLKEKLAEGKINKALTASEVSSAPVEKVDHTDPKQIRKDLDAAIQRMSKRAETSETAKKGRDNLIDIAKNMDAGLNYDGAFYKVHGETPTESLSSLLSDIGKGIAGSHLTANNGSLGDINTKKYAPETETGKRIASIIKETTENKTNAPKNKIHPLLNPGITPMILSELKIDITDGKRTVSVPANEVIEAHEKELDAYKNFILCLKGLAHANQ